MSRPYYKAGVRSIRAMSHTSYKRDSAKSIATEAEKSKREAQTSSLGHNLSSSPPNVEVIEYRKITLDTCDL